MNAIAIPNGALKSQNEKESNDYIGDGDDDGGNGDGSGSGSGGGSRRTACKYAKLKLYLSCICSMHI